MLRSLSSPRHGSPCPMLLCLLLAACAAGPRRHVELESPAARTRDPYALSVDVRAAGAIEELEVALMTVAGVATVTRRSSGELAVETIGGALLDEAHVRAALAEAGFELRSFAEPAWARAVVHVVDAAGGG